MSDELTRMGAMDPSSHEGLSNSALTSSRTEPYTSTPFEEEDISEFGDEIWGLQRYVKLGVSVGMQIQLVG